MKRLVLILFAIFVSATAWSAVNPSSTKVKLIKAHLCTSGDCTGCVVAYDGGDLNSARYLDMMNSPTLGSAEVPIGTYNCVIFELSDNIKITPASSTGTCTAGTEYTQDVCETGAPSGTLPGGSPFTCETGVEQRVAQYISTWSTRGEGANGFEPPRVNGDANYGAKLNEPLVVTASTGGVFYLDGTNQVIQDGSGGCKMNVPAFGFRRVNAQGR